MRVLRASNTAPLAPYQDSYKVEQPEDRDRISFITEFEPTNSRSGVLHSTLVHGASSVFIVGENEFSSHSVDSTLLHVCHLNLKMNSNPKKKKSPT